MMKAGNKSYLFGFDFLLSTVWVSLVIWLTILHFLGYEIPTPTPHPDPFMIEWWGFLGVPFPVLNIIGVSTGSVKLTSISIAFCGTITGVTALSFLIYEPSFASIFAVSTIFYFMSFFEILRVK